VSDEDVQTAARALLAGGFLSGMPATLARRHRRELAELFRDEFGWQVVVDDHGPVRALCQPGAAHPARGLSNRTGRPFDTQRYALLFLVLAGLEAAVARTTLTMLFDEVRTRAPDIVGLVFDHNQATSRRAFVHAVQAAVDLGVLELADGSEDDFANSGEGDALYRVDRGRLTRLLATSKPPSLAATPEAAIAENLYTSTEDGQRRQRRHRVTRALVSEPVVYRSDLTDAELDYLTNQEPRLRRVLDERFGLTLEVRSEGWVAVDTKGGLTDQQFPTISVGRASALAVVDESRSRLDADGTATWTTEQIVEFVGRLGSRFGTSWPLEATDSEGAARIAGEVRDTLVAMRLAAVVGDDLVVLPAAGRFAITEAAVTSTQATFDTEALI
jgi:uncharacterized protein (TIGR02678 family)